jgi:AAA ATPase domain/Protein of unknown function (DUF3696)
MIRISGLGVKNLRSLKQLDTVRFKPITILVGRNSAGKSSFARLLPLLKQSSETRKQSPILWWGRLVDFGTFDDVYSSLSSDGFIDVTVMFELTTLVFLQRTPYYRSKDTPLQQPGTVEATFRLGKNSEDGSTILRELHLKVFEVRIVLAFSGAAVSSVSLDGQTIEIPSNIRLNWLQGQLMPILRPANVGGGPQASIGDETLFSPRRVSRFGAANVRRAVSSFVHGNTQEDRKEEIADRLPLAPIAEFLNYCRSVPNSTTTWQSTIDAVTLLSPSLQRLHSSVILYKLDILLWNLDDAAHRYLSQVSYLEPLRATAQRYYRREEISTDELDPKGLNTPFYIQGLTAREKESLNEWTKLNFGFSLSIRNSGGHLSLNILPEGDEGGGRNLADVGLGYSQLVPVALQLWAAKNRGLEIARRASGALRGSFAVIGRTVVVEQPELHLHPAYQAKLADVFAGSIKGISARDEEMTLTIIAETHSPNLISRLGELISLGRLDAEDVQILVFEEGEDRATGTNVRIATFDSEGILKNWPIGFFDS